MAPCGAEDGCKPVYPSRACRCPERFLQPGRLLLGILLVPLRFLLLPVIPTACPSTLVLHNVLHPTLFLCKTAPCRDFFSCLTQIQPLLAWDSLGWKRPEQGQPPLAQSPVQPEFELFGGASTTSLDSLCQGFITLIAKKKIF